MITQHIFTHMVQQSTWEPVSLTEPEQFTCSKLSVIYFDIFYFYVPVLSLHLLFIILITSPFLIYEPDSDHICVGLTTKLFSGGAALFLCPAITFIHALQNVFLWRKSYTYIMQHFVNVRLLFFRYPRCSSSKVYEGVFFYFVLFYVVWYYFLSRICTTIFNKAFRSSEKNCRVVY